MKILVTGVNGFIGTHFLEKALSSTDWQIQGFDIAEDNLAPFKGNPRFSFYRGDIFKENEWLESQVKEADTVLPLAGIAKPAYYLQKPVWTFELDFEQNLKMVRLCAKHKARIIFPARGERATAPHSGGKTNLRERPFLPPGAPGFCAWRP